MLFENPKQSSNKIKRQIQLGISSFLKEDSSKIHTVNSRLIFELECYSIPIELLLILIEKEVFLVFVRFGTT